MAADWGEAGSRQRFVAATVVGRYGTMETFQQQQREGSTMKPSLSPPDDASCGAASDVAISGEQFVEEKPTFVIQSQSDHSSVSVIIEAVTSENITPSCSTTAVEKTHTAPKNSESSSSSAAAAKSSGAGSRCPAENDKRWYENLERIKPCIVDGKIDYSCIDDAKDRKKLGDFIYTQRKHFRMRNNNEDTPLTDERLKALMDVNFPFDVQKKSRGADSGKSSSKKNAIILSLTDDKYRQLMEEHFKKLGAKTTGEKIGEKQVNEEKATAQQVFDKLKGKGGIFVRLANPRNLGGGHEEMDDDEAFQKIRQDISRRMGTAKRWLDPKHSSSAKDKASTSQQLKKRSQSKNHVQPSKRPCVNTVGIEKRSDNPSKPKCSVKGDKLEYIGNYIANNVKGWEPQQRTNRLGLDHYVIYRAGVDKKTALEGKDKFTGYDKLAIWAFETHYYTQHVVDTVPGKEILERLGIIQDPYSIFVERDKELNTGERAGVSRDNRCDSSSQQLQHQTNANSGREKEVRAGVGKDNRPPSDSAPQQLPQHTSASSAHLTAAGSGNSQNVEGSFHGFKRFRQTVSDVKSMLSSAEEKRDEDGVKFFGHLCRWLESKSRDAAFVMSFRRDDIDAAVQEFKSVLSDSENDTTFKNLVEILIDQTTKIFPVADN